MPDGKTAEDIALAFDGSQMDDLDNKGRKRPYKDLRVVSRIEDLPKTKGFKFKDSNYLSSFIAIGEAQDKIAIHAIDA